MKLACEIPVRYLKDCAPETDFDFVLAHLVLHDREYREYYSKIKDTSSRRMILDNGLFELGHAIPDEEILLAASLVKPDVIIAPDVLGDKDRTINSFEIFQYNKITNIGVVIQGKTLDEAVECYKYFKDKPQVSCICFPFGAKYKEFESLSKDMQNMCSRVALIEMLTRQNLINISKWHHLLGSNLPGELRYLSKYNWITSADTSIPMISVMRNTPLLESREKLIRPDNYFNYSFSEEIVCLFNDSISELRRLIA